MVIITGSALWVLLAARIYLIYTPLSLRILNYNDFGKFYYSLQSWADGGSLYVPTVATWIALGNGTGAHFWNMNPPHLHLLLWPLLHLPIGVAFGIWTAFNIFGAVWSLRAIAQDTGIRPRSSIVALAIVSEAAFSWAVTGQLSGLMMAAVTALWLAIRRERWTRAGLILGVTCSIKPFLGVFLLWWMVQRRWRAVAWSGASAAAAVAVGAMVYGPSAYLQWVDVLRDVKWVGAAMNASIAGAIGRTWSVHALVDDPLALQLASAASLIALAAGVWLARRSESPDHAVLILLLTALLASPLGWMYYLWMIVGPALVVWRSPSWTVRVGLLGCMVPHSMIWPFGSALWAATIGSIYTWSLLLLWAGTCRAGRIPRLMGVSNGAP